jgi:stage V sporulation protein AE
LNPKKDKEFLVMPSLLDFIYVFFFGGTLCLIAQLLIDLTSLTPARILVLYVSLGVLIYAIGLYEPLYSVFSSGISVPLIGFGATIGRGVREAIDQSGAIGILTGGLTSSAAGITSALIFGLLAALIFKSKPKKL